MQSFAKGTEVPVFRSRAQIDELLKARKATNRAIVEADGPHGGTFAVVQFDVEDRRIRFRVFIPSAQACMEAARGGKRTASRADQLHGQREREVWRQLHLVIKAKFVNVDTGIETVEEAFLPQTVTPDGRTFAEHALPALRDSFANGLPPVLFLGPGGGK
jgi:hypothetical protein